MYAFYFPMTILEKDVGQSGTSFDISKNSNSTHKNKIHTIIPSGSIRIQNLSKNLVTTFIQFFD